MQQGGNGGSAPNSQRGLRDLEALDNLLPPSSWRERASQNFVQRRHTPAEAKASRDALAKSSKSAFPIRLPRLPIFSASLKLQASQRESEGVVADQIDRPRSSKSIRLQKLGSSTNLGPLPPTKGEVLYSLDPLDNSKLPLEMFDDLFYQEHDKTPLGWIQLGEGRGGTPARSPFYSGRAWSWEPCLVLSFDEEAETFVIRFPQAPDVPPKMVSRLSVLFDQEDPDMFHARVAHCQEMRLKHEVSMLVFKSNNKLLLWVFM